MHRFFKEHLPFVDTDTVGADEAAAKSVRATLSGGGGAPAALRCAAASSGEKNTL